VFVSGRLLVRGTGLQGKVHAGSGKCIEFGLISEVDNGLLSVTEAMSSGPLHVTVRRDVSLHSSQIVCQAMTTFYGTILRTFRRTECQKKGRETQCYIAS